MFHWLQSFSGLPFDFFPETRLLDDLLHDTFYLLFLDRLFNHVLYVFVGTYELLDLRAYILLRVWEMVQQVLQL